MKTKITENTSAVNVKALQDLTEKFSKINAFFESGREVPHELTKNFVSFPLSDDPFKDIK